MGEDELTCNFYTKINGQYERIGKIEEMRFSVDTSNGEDKTACTIAAINKLNEAYIVACRCFSETVTIIQAYTKTLFGVFPNKRVVWLAFHHKKARVRKKNYRRVLRWLERRLNE